MNAQLEIPLARCTDPASSHLAADGVRPRIKGQCDVVLRFLRGHPFCTALELASYYRARHGGDFPEYFRKRLPILRRNGLVVNGEMRKCRISTELAQTWIAA